MMWIKNGDKICEKLKTILEIVLILVSIWCAIFYSKECKEGIINGISFCTSVLIPSLFIFMVIAPYVANSNVNDVVAKILKNPMTKLFKLPPMSTGAILLSIIGGYPVGAGCVANLYSNKAINKAEAKKLSMIAFCSGPGFVINYVGCALLNSKQAGIILFVSQLVAYFTTMIVCCAVYKSEYDFNCKISYHNNKANIVNAVADGTKATVNMCAMVILFSALISICDCVFKDYQKLCDFVCALLEVTTACSRLKDAYSLVTLSFIIGFGGLCVHFQIFCALKDIGINKMLFFLFRIMQGITSAFATYILLILFNPVIEVFSTVNKTTATSSTTLLGSLMLIITAVCFLNSLHYTNLTRR